MVTILHAAMLAESCFLSELLYWVALRRFPLAIDDLEGGEFRFSKECDLYAYFAIDTPVSYSECDLAGLPPNPRYTALIEEKVVFDAKLLKQMEEYIERLSGLDLEDLVARRQEALTQVEEIGKWDHTFLEFLEYFKSKIYVDLYEGKLIGTGIKLAATNTSQIDHVIEKNDIRLEELEFSQIGQREWMYSRIDWDNSVLFGAEFSYCWVRFEVESMLSTYPLPELLTVCSMRRLCDSYILDEQNPSEVSRETRRGRPPLPWELFHVEVAARAKEGTLPDKKEAAISELEEWFRNKHGIKVGRSSIGQKLTPYYQRFFRTDPEIPVE
jgi:hypothetical protein